MNQRAFSMGGLLYSPANNTDVAHHILAGDWPCLTSVCLCLEDSIRDCAVDEAEAQLVRTLTTLSMSNSPLPMLFVRVRGTEHLRHIHQRLSGLEGVLTGYVFPKFDTSNAEEYLSELERFDVPLCAMPILESRRIARIETRVQELTAIREIIDRHRDLILNIRVGGNDFCNLFGLRRSVSQSVYDLGVVRDILVDIVNMFSDEYVVSGPVWEYYGGDWAKGLKRELELDIANGFIGKTAIHPCQLPVIFESLKVSRADYDDARRILHWSDDQRGVAGSADGERMNEVKCHGRWAERIMMRARAYGLRGEK